MTRPVKLGIIGCGNISRAYLETASGLDNIEVTACSDIDMQRARKKAEQFRGVRACSVEELLADEEIAVVVNLTIPAAHFEVAMEALKAGKNVYNEKPLAANRREGRKLLEVAREKGLLVGTAPDTFLGDGIQTCRKLMDDGAIGEPVAAAAFMLCHGHESWHPDPVFYYAPGGGPMFDMGPYYLTALVNLIGPVKSVASSAKITFPERTIGSGPKRGEKIKVKTPTHIAGIMNFENGAIGTIVTSYDVWGSEVPFIEIYGTEGTLSTPDPNTFGGDVRILRAGKKKWERVPLLHGFSQQGRSIGVSDMAETLLSGGGNRASGELAYHVLDVMCSFLDASCEGHVIEVKSTCKRPDALPLNEAKVFGRSKTRSRSRKE